MSISPQNVTNPPSVGSAPGRNRSDLSAAVEPAGGKFVIGIDLGGTKLLGAIARANSGPLAELEIATLEQSPVSQVCDLVHTLLGEIGAGLGQLGQVVIGVPGVVDSQGAVSLSPHVLFSPGISFAGAIADELGVPVFADNDANIAAFGEYSLKSSASRLDVVLVTIGTGVGMGIVVNGKIVRGAHGAAGEIGSMPFSGTARVGHYEGMVSTAGIRDRYRQAGGPLESVREIFDAADHGEATAYGAIEDFLDDVARGLGVVVSLLDPGLIVLGGGIGARPGVAERVASRLSALVPTPCSVSASHLGTRAGLVGALALANRLAGAGLEAAA